MKSLFLFGLVGLFSVVSIVEVQAGRRHCGGKRSRGCGNTCYVQPCQGGGCQVNGNGYAHPGTNGAVEVAPGTNVPPPANP